MNGLTDLGLHKMQEHLDYYIKAVNSGLSHMWHKPDRVRQLYTNIDNL